MKLWLFPNHGPAFPMHQAMGFSGKRQGLTRASRLEGTQVVVMGASVERPRLTEEFSRPLPKSCLPRGAASCPQRSCRAPRLPKSCPKLVETVLPEPKLAELG